MAAGGLTSMTDEELEREIRRLLEEYIRAMVPDLTQLTGASGISWNV